jgi:hypothetical protein
VGSFCGDDRGEECGYLEGEMGGVRVRKKEWRVFDLEGNELNGGTMVFYSNANGEMKG